MQCYCFLFSNPHLIQPRVVQSSPISYPRVNFLCYHPDYNDPFDCHLKPCDPNHFHFGGKFSLRMQAFDFVCISSLL